MEMIVEAKNERVPGFRREASTYHYSQFLRLK